MRFVAPALLIACAGLVVWDHAVRAGGDGEPAARTYIAAGSSIHYRTRNETTPARQLGPRALAALARIKAGAAASTPAKAASSDRAPDLPASWRTRGLAGAPTGSLPMDAAFGAGKSCRCKTRLADTSRERVAALYGTRRFRVGDELSKLTTLRLRMRFRDGMVAYINGREVARRNLATDLGPMDFARRARGPEWETFHIPVIPGLLTRGENLLAVEVRPSPYRLAPALDLELSASKGPRLIRGPVVQRVGRDSAVIAFDTDVPARGSVMLGSAASSLDRTIHSAGGGLAQHHTVLLTGLPAGKAVYYRVRVEGDPGPLYRFHTAPAANEPVRFVVYGDVRAGHRTHDKIVQSLLREAPDFVLVTGDLVLRGSDEGDWQRFFDVTSELLPRIPYYTVAGNHDLGRAGDELRRLNEIFTLWPAPPGRPEWGHWYSFDVAGLHFVMLDSNSYRHAEQLEWLERDLASARKRGARVIFAATHDGPYSRGYHRGNRYAASKYAPVLARHRVLLTFSGHDHLYQRGKVKGLDYVVSGGGGAPLYPVVCGVRGKRRCRGDDGMDHVASTHHYVLVEVFKRTVRMCPKTPDRAPLEPCVTYRIR